MEVSFSDSFRKAYRNLNTSGEFETKFLAILETFINDPFHPKLKTHKLSGRLKDLWSFSIGYDLRVVFFFTGEKPKRAVLVDIGRHNEVY